MGARSRATSLTVCVSALVACSDFGWTRLEKPYSSFELRAVIEQPDLFAPYSIDPESGAAATRSCPEVEIRKERVGAAGAGYDVSYAYSEDERALRACAGGAETSQIQILLGPLESSGKAGFRTYEVSTVAVVSGADITRGRVVEDHGAFSVRLELARGKVNLASFSERHSKGRLAVVLDGQVIAAPRVPDALAGDDVILLVPNQAAGKALLHKLTGT